MEPMKKKVSTLKKTTANKQSDGLNWKAIKEKIPHHVDIEFDDKVYQFRTWKEFSPTNKCECICASGESEPPQGQIQIGKMFGVQTMQEMRRILKCGLQNQKDDRESGRFK
jgi:hypothetical protein